MSGFHEALVSVGIPTYNNPEGLRRALSSIVNQTYTNLEIIVSDNCSPDPGTERVVREFMANDNRIKYFRQSTNKGPAFNFEFVRDNSRGEYFMWLADDDWLDNIFIQECLAFYARESGYFLVCGQARFYRDGKFMFEGERLPLTQDTPEQRIVEYFKNVTYNSLFYGVAPKPLVDAFKIKNHVGEDWIFIATLAAKGKVAVLDNIYSHRGLNGMSSRGADSLCEGLGVTTPPGNVFDEVMLQAFRFVMGEFTHLSIPGRLMLGIKVSYLINRRYSRWPRLARYLFRKGISNVFGHPKKYSRDPIDNKY